MKEVNNKVLWLFAIGQLGWSILAGIITNYLIYFYQPDLTVNNIDIFIPQGKVILGVVTIIGAIAALGRIFDAITDPIIANMSDSCKNPKGRRIPFMKFIALPFAVVTVLVFFAPVKGTSGLNGIWLLVMLLLFYLCMTIYCTPYNALIPELGKTQKNRVNVSTYISLTFIIGTAIAFLAPVVWSNFEASLGRVKAMQYTFAIMAVIALICMLVPVYTIKEKDYCDSKPTNSDTFKSLLKIFKNKDFMTFIKSDVIYFIAVTMFNTGLPFYVTSLMKLEESYITLLFMIMTGLSLLCYPSVNIMAKKYGKKNVIITGFVLFTIAYVITTISGMFELNGLIYGILICVFSAIAMAILGILPQAIVADLAQVNAIETGENCEGMYFAARTFAFKMGQSLAMLIFTGLASISVSTGLGYRLTALTAAILCVISALILIGYNEKKIIGIIEAKSNC